MFESIKTISLRQRRFFLIFLSVVLFVRLIYIFSFPLNFGGDASVYYTMIIDQHSNLLMAPGYPFFVMLPYEWLHRLWSKIWTIPADRTFSPWWQSSTLRGDIQGAKAFESDFSWGSVFQNHDFILFQHAIALLALFCGFKLVRKYFGFPIGIIFLGLAGLSPLSLEWPSCSLPEWLQGSFLVFWLYFADRAREAAGIRKLGLYGLLGLFAAGGCLIKFNGFPVFASLFIGLFFLDRESIRKTGLKLFVSASTACTLVAVFVMSYHFPTTGTIALSMNTWPLADKVFQFLPHPSISPDMGIHSKRLLAMHKDLPKHTEEVLSPAPYFRHLNAVDTRAPYQGKLAPLMQRTESELDHYLTVHGYDPIYEQQPALRVAYYIGLQEYSSLLRGVYIEAATKYPFLFLQDTANNFFHDFLMKENSYVFRPQWDEVQAGRDHSQPSRWGFVRFLWPHERYVCYHENVVWQPGAWFFTKWQALWPSTRFLWLLAFVAFAVAVSDLQRGEKRKQSYLIVFLFLLALMFVWVSNMAWIFRLKEYEFIRAIPTLLAAVGLYQSVQIVRQVGRWSIFRLKKQVIQ